MKRILLLSITMCLLQVSMMAQMTAAKNNGIAFRELSMAEALKAAKAENKLIFVDCYTTWCGPCKMLSNVVFKDPLFADYFNRQFINLKIDMEKGEGPELAKKYEVRGYPTLLFLNSNGDIAHRLIGAKGAPELLKQVKLGVEGGGLTGLRKQYEAGDRDSSFIYGYINLLSQGNQRKEAETVATDYLKGREKKMLEYKFYFDLFNYYVHDVYSSPFQYVAKHEKELCEKYPQQAPVLHDRLVRNWIGVSQKFLEPTKSGETLNEQGLKDYVDYMKQYNVPEAKWIEENIRLTRDANMLQWPSFMKRLERILASKTMLGDDQHLLEWAKRLNTSCDDVKLRTKAAKWCENACKELMKKEEEIKKNLPPGTIPAFSMVDYKSLLLQESKKLREPKK